jgi:hypothetical protein
VICDLDALWVVTNNQREDILGDSLGASWFSLQGEKSAMVQRRTHMESKFLEITSGLANPLLIVSLKNFFGIIDHQRFNNMILLTKNYLRKVAISLSRFV